MPFSEWAYKSSESSVDKREQYNLSDLLLQDHDSGLIHGYLGNNFLLDLSSASLLIQHSLIHLTIHTTMYVSRDISIRSLLGIITSSSQSCWFPALFLQISLKQVLLQKLTLCTRMILT